MLLREQPPALPLSVGPQPAIQKAARQKLHGILAGEAPVTPDMAPVPDRFAARMQDFGWTAGAGMTGAGLSA